MKRINKKTVASAASLAVLFFTAQGAKAGGMHDIRTNSTGERSYLENAQPVQSGFGESSSFTKTKGKKSGQGRGRKKYFAHKRKKSTKSKQATDRMSSGSFSMLMQTEDV